MLAKVEAAGSLIAIRSRSIPATSASCSCTASLSATMSTRRRTSCCLSSGLSSAAAAGTEWCGASTRPLACDPCRPVDNILVFFFLVRPSFIRWSCSSWSGSSIAEAGGAPGEGTAARRSLAGQILGRARSSRSSGHGDSFGGLGWASGRRSAGTLRHGGTSRL